MNSKENLTDYLLIFLKKKRAIFLFILFFAGGGFIYALTAPPIYRAECRILPPVQGGSMASMMLSQMGGLANLTGISPGSTNGDLLIGVMRGETIVDRVIDQFDLMALYKQKSRLKMRDFVTSQILQATNDVRSNIVSIAVLDEDPLRTAQMANAFVDELKNVMRSLAIGEAAQRRLFFEQQMLQARKTLDEAEDEFSKYQEESGLVGMAPQVEAMVTSIAALRAQVAAKEVELSSLKTYASGNNPNLRRAESELVALRAALKRLEQEQKSEAGNTPMASLRDAPQMGLEYQRRVRNVQYASAMHDLMLKQFEAAKIDESRESMVVQIVDPATPPDYKFKPKRSLIVVLSIMLGLCLGMLWALFADYVETAKKDPEQTKILKEIKDTFSIR